MGLDGLLHKRATLLRAEAAVDAGGDVVETRRTLAVRVPCAVERREGHVAVDASGERRVEHARIYFSARGAALPEENDFVLVDGCSWRVRATRREAGPRETVYVVEAERALPAAAEAG